MKQTTVFKRVLTGTLAVVMLLSMTACGPKKTQGPKKNEDLSWLNTDGTLPMVKEGTEKTLHIAVRMYEDSGDPEDQWF